MTVNTTVIEDDATIRPDGGVRTTERIPDVTMHIDGKPVIVRHVGYAAAGFFPKKPGEDEVSIVLADTEGGYGLMYLFNADEAKAMAASLLNGVDPDFVEERRRKYGFTKLEEDGNA